MWHYVKSARDLQSSTSPKDERELFSCEVCAKHTCKLELKAVNFFFFYMYKGIL